MIELLNVEPRPRKTIAHVHGVGTAGPRVGFTTASTFQGQSGNTYSCDLSRARTVPCALVSRTSRSQTWVRSGNETSRTDSGTADHRWCKVQTDHEFRKPHTSQVTQVPTARI